MAQPKLQKKLEYLKKTGVSDSVTSYLSAHIDEVHPKLLVWVGRALQYKINLQSEVSNEESADTVFLGIKVIDYDDEKSERFEGKLVSELTDKDLKKAPVRRVSLIETIKYIEDWMLSVSVDIGKYTIESAYEESRRWHDDISKYKATNTYKDDDANVLFRHGNYKVVEIVKKHDMVVEGQHMGHCVGSAGYYDRTQTKKDYKILSVRDEKNQPHATMELDGKMLKQIKGKQNKTPVDKYIPVIVLWIIDSKIDVSECNDFLNFPDEVVIDGDKYELIKYEIIEENIKDD